MFAIFLNALGLSLAYCAPPGVVAAETIRRGLGRGYLPALVVQLASLFGDTVWAVFGLAGVAIFVQQPVLQAVIGLFGVGLLVFLAIGAIRTAWRGQLPGNLSGQPPDALQTRATLSTDALAGAALSLSNPYAIGFWLGVGSTAIPSDVISPNWKHYLTFLLGFELGAIIWCFVFAALVVAGQRWLTVRFFQWVNWLSALVMLGFALQLAGQLWRAWMI
jgi:threonine/homoserine/homoserine lactone efflux protein